MHAIGDAESLRVIEREDFWRFMRELKANRRDTYETCRRYGKRVVIMDPVKGGSLAQVNRHAEIKPLFDAADPAQNPASWALLLWTAS